MTTTETSEITAVVQHIRSWPPAMRIELARQIFETVAHTDGPEVPVPQPRGYSAAEVQALLKINQPAPDDARVQQWIDERAQEKYGK